MRQSLSLVVLALVAFGARLLGQGQPAPALAALHAGVTIRIWSDAPPMSKQTAVLVAAERDSFRIALDSAAPLRAAAMRYEDLRRVDLQIPRSRGSGALRGFGYGLLTALVVDVALVGYAGTQNTGDTDLTAGVIGVIGTPIIIAGGTIIGAMNPGNRWTVVYQR